MPKLPLWFLGRYNGAHMAVPWFSSIGFVILLAGGSAAFVWTVALLRYNWCQSDDSASFAQHGLQHQAIRVDHPQGTVVQSARKAKSTMLDVHLLGAGRRADPYDG